MNDAEAIAKLRLPVLGVAPQYGSETQIGSIDDRALAPITVAYKHLFGGRTPDGNSYLVSAILLAVDDSTYLDTVQSRVSGLLRERHGLPADGSANDFRFLIKLT